MAFVGNIEELTLDNPYFRRTLYTPPDQQMQLVVMSIPVGGEIGWESHPETQFTRIEEGMGVLQLADSNGEITDEHWLYDGMAFIIPAYTNHNVVNLHDTDNLQLYTIYAPAES